MSSKPKYDFGYIKKINQAIYEDFNDLIEAYLSNIQASVFSIANALFEKGFKYFLIKEEKMDEFFPEKDPNLTKMVLSSTFSSSRNYIRSNIVIDYNVVVKVRDYANNKKHDLVQSNPILEKALILTELFSLYVQIHNLYFSPKVGMPDKEYIQFVSSIDKYKEHKLDEVDAEIEKKLAEADREVAKRLSSIDNQLEEKEKELIKSTSALEEKKELLKEADNKLEKKKEELEKFEKYLSERKKEILTSESSTSNNELYELANNFLQKEDFDSALRVFKSLQNSNITDLRAIIGIVLCIYKVRDLDELVDKAIKTKRSLRKESVFDDIKFLKKEDKEFLIDIADNIDFEMLYNDICESIDKKEYRNALSLISNYEKNGGKRDVASLKQHCICEPIYVKAKEAISNKNYSNALDLLKQLDDYKDSKDLIKWIQEEKERIAKAVLEAKKERERTIRENNKRWAESCLKDGNFSGAKSYYELLGDEEKVSYCNQCLELEGHVNKFKRGLITRERLESRFDEYPKDIVDRIISKHSSIDEIEDRINTQKTFDRLLKEYKKNLARTDFDSLFTSIEMLQEIQQIDTSKLLTWEGTGEYDLSSHLRLILKSNEFNFEFIKKVLNMTIINPRGVLIVRFHYTLNDFLKYQINTFSRANVNKIKELDQIILKNEEAFKNCKIEEGFYSQLANAELERRKSEIETAKRKKQLDTINEEFDLGHYQNCIDLIEKLPNESDRNNFIRTKCLCFVKLGYVNETLNIFKNDKQFVFNALDDVISFTNLSVFIDKFRGTQLENELIKRYACKFDSNVESEIKKGNISKYFDNRLEEKNNYLSHIKKLNDEPLNHRKRKRREAIASIPLGIFGVVCYLMAFISFFASDKSNGYTPYWWFFIPLTTPFGFAFVFSAVSLFTIKGSLKYIDMPLFDDFKKTKIYKKMIQLMRCLYFGFSYNVYGEFVDYSDIEIKRDYKGQLLKLFMLVSIIYELIAFFAFIS